METFNGVMAWVGIAGKWTGTGRLLVSPRMACILAGHLLMSTFEGVDEEVLDAVAEIANMVVGNVKNVLEEDLGQLCLSVPTVIYGKNYMTRSGKVQDWLVIPRMASTHGLLNALGFSLLGILGWVIEFSYDSQ